MSDEEYLDTRAPDIAFYALLGQVNYVWAQLDAVSSAAFASLLNLDPAELGIAIGRIETQAKIEECTLLLDIAVTTTYQAFSPT